jgi:hypothetical protein
MLPGFVWDVGVRAAFLGRGRNFLSSLVQKKSPIKQCSACLFLGKRGNNFKNRHFASPVQSCGEALRGEKKRPPKGGPFPWSSAVTVSYRSIHVSPSK